jgi:Tfp pilus assembly protein PilN
MGIDLKKEIKLSDLLPSRGAKNGDGEKAPREAKPPKEQKAKEPRGRRFGKRAPKEELVGATLAHPPLDIPLMRAFNLLQGEEIKLKSGASRVQLGGAAPFPQIGVALLAVAVFAGLSIGYTLMSSKAHSNQDRVDALRAELAGLGQAPSPTPQPSGGTSPALATASGRKAALATALASRTAWDRVVRELSLVIPEDVWLTDITSGAQDSSQPAGTTPPSAVPGTPTGIEVITLKGKTNDQGQVAVLLSRLETIPEFSVVQLQSSAFGDDGVYAFTIVAQVSKGAPAS